MENITRVKRYFISCLTSSMTLCRCLFARILEGISDIEWVMTHRFFSYSTGLNERGQYLYENRLNVQLKKQSLMGPSKIMKTASPESVKMAPSNNEMPLVNKMPSVNNMPLVNNITLIDKAASVDNAISIDTAAISNEDNLSKKDSQNKKDTLDKKNILINQMSAGIAHEINNPLSFVSSNLSTLQEYTDSLKEILIQQQHLMAEISTQRTLSATEAMALQNDAEIKYMLDDLEELISESMTGVARVKKVVEDFSVVSHVDCLDSSDEDINKILEFSLMQVVIPSNHHIQFVKEYDDVMLTKINAKKINKAFLALISNAVLAVEANAKIILRTTQLKSHIRIDIIDNGCGIPEEALSTVCNPFYTTRKIGEGVGLGLHMAQNTAESHGGALNISSKVGQGTVLTMILPMTNSEVNVSDWPMDTQRSL